MRNKSQPRKSTSLYAKISRTEEYILVHTGYIPDQTLYAMSSATISFQNLNNK